jgi:hypothetical protein
MVYFDDGRAVIVHSADAKSFKRRDLIVAHVKARKKAEAKVKRGINDVSAPCSAAKPIEVRCIG